MEVLAIQNRGEIEFHLPSLSPEEHFLEDFLTEIQKMEMIGNQ